MSTVLAIAAFLSSHSPAGAQDLAPNALCGPVYPYRLEGQVCSAMQMGAGRNLPAGTRVPHHRAYIGDGFLAATVPGQETVCCVTKEFAISQGRLRRDTREETCGVYFDEWRAASIGRRGKNAASWYERIKETCTDELRQVASAANVSLDKPKRSSEPSTGALGASLYGGLAGKSATELENIASERRRDRSQDMSIADVMMLGMQLGAMAGQMYPGRSMRFGRSYAPGQSAASPRPVSVPSAAPRRSSSDITGLGR